MTVKLDEEEHDLMTCDLCRCAGDGGSGRRLW
jgi:hypothetical protein